MRVDKHQYKALRRQIGTWQKVADMLGVHWRTVARRESGELEITKSAALAMQALKPTWYAVPPPLPDVVGIAAIPGWPGYAVTKAAQVYSCRSRYPSPEFPYQDWAPAVATKGSRGYWVFGLYKDGRRRQLKLHQLVLMAHVGPKPEGQQGCHRDDDPDHNHLDNLRWDTPSGNRRDMVRNGRSPDRRGQKHPMAKLTELDIVAIKRRRNVDKALLREIADEFNISEGMVSLVARDKTWKHLNKSDHGKKSIREAAPS